MSEAAESEDRGNDRDDEEDNCPIEHSGIPLRDRFERAIVSVGHERFGTM